MTLTTPVAIAPRMAAAVRSTMARTSVRAVAVPLALFLLALGIRLVAAQLVVFPVTEDGMYYQHVAQRVIEGHGLSSLALWSYSTPPLVLPRPGFEIWMPGASLFAIPWMALFGPTHEAAQAGSVLLGSLVAPIAWWLGRDAARSMGLGEDRVHAIAVGSGALAAVLGALVAAAADPDSTTLFLVTGALAAIMMQRTLADPTRSRGVLLGMTLALAYLTRQEAVWLGATYLIMVALAARTWTEHRGREAARRLVPVVVGGLLLVVPWLIRQWSAFGTPFPGQALENALHIRGDDIFAYLDRPSIDRFLAQGLDTMLAQRVTAVGYQLLGIVVFAFPVGVLGTIGAIALSRTPALRASGALFALIISGWLTFLATALLFPVATLWGTYRHSAGPLLLGCVVTSILVIDLAVRRVAAARPGRRAPSWMAPLIVIALSIPVGLAWVSLHAGMSVRLRADMAAVAAALPGQPAVEAGASAELAPGETADAMSNLPIFTAAATGRRVLALPDEPPEAVVALAKRYGVDTLVVIGERGRYPGALLTTPRHPCLASEPERVPAPGLTVWLFRLRPACPVG